MKRFSEWCLKTKILIVEMASTCIFVLLVSAIVWHEVSLLLKWAILVGGAYLCVGGWPISHQY